LTTTFAPQKRETLAAFMAANAEPGPDYGTIRLLRLPRNTTIPGPTQVQNNFESDPVVARDLSLFRSQGAEVELGNLLTLPVGGGLIYVEPLYIRSSGAESYPLLRKVLVAFGSNVGYSDTLEQSLEQVFGVSAGGGGNGNGGNGGNGGTGDGTASDELNRALADAEAALIASEQALKDGDFAAYGQAQQDLSDAIARAVAAQERVSGAPVPEPTTSASPDASPAPSG
jgi:uncharacterized membrane protein (UPF0182 family)